MTGDLLVDGKKQFDTHALAPVDYPRGAYLFQIDGTPNCRVISVGTDFNSILEDGQELCLEGSMNQDGRKVFARLASHVVWDID